MDDTIQPPADQGGQPAGGQPAGGQPAGGQPAGGQPPVAQPAGAQPPKNDLSGIMEENVDVSSLVSNAGNQQQIQDFITWAKANMPAHPTTEFDDNKFIELLASSISLTQNEKKKIIESVPKLSQFQVDELMKIFIEEQQKFTELEKKHAEQMAELEKQHASPEAQAAKKEEEDAKAKEDEEADALKKSLGL